jgi:hypothetical protein
MNIGGLFRSFYYIYYPAHFKVFLLISGKRAAIYRGTGRLAALS